MPIYEYLCRKCEKEFEAFQNIKEKPLTKCKYCGGRVDRLISQSSFALKGGGWYQDGYSKKEAKKEAKKEPTKESTKAEKKPETKEKAKKETKKAS